MAVLEEGEEEEEEEEEEEGEEEDAGTKAISKLSKSDEFGRFEGSQLSMRILGGILRTFSYSGCSEDPYIKAREGSETVSDDEDEEDDDDTNAADLLGSSFSCFPSF